MAKAIGYVKKVTSYSKSCSAGRRERSGTCGRFGKGDGRRGCVKGLTEAREPSGRAGRSLVVMPPALPA